MYTVVHDPIIINSNYLRQSESTTRFLINADLKHHRLLKTKLSLIIGECTKIKNKKELLPLQKNVFGTIDASCNYKANIFINN